MRKSRSLRRAAEAIREARSNDALVLARRALEAAVRTDLDLLELLPDQSPTQHGAEKNADWAKLKTL